MTKITKTLLVIILPFLLICCSSDDDGNSTMDNEETNSDITIKLFSTDLIDKVMFEILNNEETVKTQTFEKVSKLSFNSANGTKIKLSMADIGNVVYDLQVNDNNSNKTLIDFKGLECLVECSREFSLVQNIDFLRD